MTEAPYLAALTPEQRQAVLHKDGPLLVLAGAGSGKTKVLTTRIGHLIKAHAVPPEAILAVTFTNKAAGEMRERLVHMCGGSGAKVWMSTFHRFGARLLRTHHEQADLPPGYSIVDQDEQLKLLKALAATMFPEEAGKEKRERNWDEKLVRAKISAAKNKLVTPEVMFIDTVRFPDDKALEATCRLYAAYEARLKMLGAVDLDDLLLKPVALLRDHPELLERYRAQYRYLLVDEYQDTNEAQYTLLEQLARGHGNLMVVGDDDQSIYAFRGADIENILNFERDFPGAEVIRLEHNFRSTPEILGAANGVIAHNARRKGKTLRANLPSGAPITVVHTPADLVEAQWIADALQQYVEEGLVEGYDACAVLYRANSQSRALEQAFVRRGIPYTIVGGVGFYDRAEVKDAMAYLRLLVNPQDRLAFLRLLNTPRRGLGEKSALALAAFAEAQGCSYLDALARAPEVPKLPKTATKPAADLAAQFTAWSVVRARGSVRATLDRIVDDLQWLTRLDEEGDEGRQRADNLRELIAAAGEFDEIPLDDALEANPLLAGSQDPVTRFLEQATLVTGSDTAHPERAVTLMTMHASKGLEFPVVVCAGLEEGMFPNLRNVDGPEDEQVKLEEERRLCYVALTRAKQHLVLTYADQRRSYDGVVELAPSRFLRELPPSLVHAIDAMPDVNSTFFRAQSAFRRRDGGRPRLDPRSSLARAQQAVARPAGPSIPGAATGVATGHTSPVVPLQPGDPVQHPSFGAGTALAILPMAPEPKVVCDFPGAGGKKVVPAFSGGLTRR